MNRGNLLRTLTPIEKEKEKERNGEMKEKARTSHRKKKKQDKKKTENCIQIARQMIWYT